MQLKLFEQQLKEISKRGYIKTFRSGNTGVGHTLEQLLGLSENNIPLPDLGGKIELKVQRQRATNRITLFTKSPYWAISAKQIITHYGYINGNERMALKITLTGKRFVKGLRLQFNKKTQTIEIIDEKHTVLAFWKISDLLELFNKKLLRLIIVKAATQYSGRKERYHYDEAYLLSDGNKNGFIKALQDESMVIEFRMHLRKTGSVRDHGSAFRMAENKLDILFRNKKNLI